MANCYSIDLRKKVIDYIKSGGRKKDACKLFNIGNTTLYQWTKQFESLGHIRPRTPSVRKGYKFDHDAVIEYALKHPEATQYEVAQHFSTYQSVIRHIYLKFNITRKKRLYYTKKEILKKEMNS